MEEFKSIDLRGINLFFGFLVRNINTDDISDIAKKVKNYQITNEQQMETCAQLLFDNAKLDSSSATKCSYLAKELADITIVIKENPQLVATFKDYIVKISHSSFEDLFKGPSNSQSIGTIIFIGHLFNAELISSSLLRYWLLQLKIRNENILLDNILLTVQPKIISMSAKTNQNPTIDSIMQIIKERELNIQQARKQTNASCRSSSVGSSPTDNSVGKSSQSSKSVITTFKEYLNKIKDGKSTNFALKTLRNCSNENRMNCARLLIQMVEKYPEKAKEYAFIVNATSVLNMKSDGRNQTFASYINNFCGNEVGSSLNACAFKNPQEWKQLAGLGIFMGELYNSDVIKSSLMYKWFDQVLKVDISKSDQAAQTFMKVFNIVTEKMKENDPSKFNYFKNRYDMKKSVAFSSTRAKSLILPTVESKKKLPKSAEEEIKNILNSLTASTNYRALIITKLNDLTMFKKCSNLLIQKALTDNELAVACGYICIRMLGNEIPFNDAKSITQVSCEEEFDKLFTNEEPLRMKTSLAHAINVISCIGQLHIHNLFSRTEFLNVISQLRICAKRDMQVALPALAHLLTTNKNNRGLFDNLSVDVYQFLEEHEDHPNASNKTKKIIQNVLQMMRPLMRYESYESITTAASVPVVFQTSRPSSVISSISWESETKFPIISKLLSELGTQDEDDIREAFDTSDLTDIDCDELVEFIYDSALENGIGESILVRFVKIFDDERPEYSLIDCLIRHIEQKLFEFETKLNEIVISDRNEEEFEDKYLMRTYGELYNAGLIEFTDLEKCINEIVHTYHECWTIYFHSLLKIVAAKLIKTGDGKYLEEYVHEVSYQIDTNGRQTIAESELSEILSDCINF